MGSSFEYPVLEWFPFFYVDLVEIRQIHDALDGRSISHFEEVVCQASVIEFICVDQCFREFSDPATVLGMVCTVSQGFLDRCDVGCMGADRNFIEAKKLRIRECHESIRNIVNFTDGDIEGGNTELASFERDNQVGPALYSPIPSRFEMLCNVSSVVNRGDLR